MLQAQLSGKLTRQEEELEDLLTSNVFGSITYVPPEDGLFLLLSASEHEAGQSVTNLPPISKVEYDFWPRLRLDDSPMCEPDVLIKITHTHGEKTVWLVEAKYRSGKSSQAEEGEAPTDQLAREWDNLLGLAESEQAKPMILYVTADFSYPIEDVQQAISEFRKKRPDRETPKVAWISWRKLPGLFGHSRHQIVLDLVAVLRNLQLIYYAGIRDLEAVPMAWSFEVVQSTFGWSNLDLVHPDWQYGPYFFGEWPAGDTGISWRFGS